MWYLQTDKEIPGGNTGLVRARYRNRNLKPKFRIFDALSCNFFQDQDGKSLYSISAQQAKHISDQNNQTTWSETG